MNLFKRPKVIHHFLLRILLGMSGSNESKLTIFYFRNFKIQSSDPREYKFTGNTWHLLFGIFFAVFDCNIACKSIQLNQFWL